MNQNKIKTAEFVSPMHPDKQCDIIADTLLDAYLAGDAKSRCAIEVMGGHGQITISGEVTSTAEVDIPKVVRSIVGDFKVNVVLVKQSLAIAQGVDAGGAGDQGIMIGYATRETESFMPLEYELARNLCRDIYKQYPFDGKTQVTVEWGSDGVPRTRTVVASSQNSKSKELLALVRTLIKADEYLVNPAGEWTLGGFDADSGLSGRKIVIDNYGPEIGIGGGSFSGKDYTKVDRSGAYMARRIGIYLTNSLEEAHARNDGLFGGIGLSQSIAEEALKASEIKQKRPIMVVVGNPPYSVSSSNKGDWIQNLIKPYKEELGEKKTNYS